MNNELKVKDIAGARKELILLLVTGAVILAPGVTGGVELCDSGFYATFYDNIFNAPGSVSYNFMYYLSGVAGGCISLLTGGSLLALRIAGAATCLLCIWLVWRMGRGKTMRAALLAGVIAVSAGALSAPLSFYNDNMTVLLALLSLTLIPTSAGSNRRDMTLAAAAGFVAGLNVWTRIPNVLEYFFIALAPLCGARGSRLKRIAGMWTAGWLGGVGFGILLAAVPGHLPLLIGSVADLFDIGGSGSDESTHGLKALVMTQVDAWLKIIMLMARLCAVAGLAWYFSRGIRSGWIRALLWVAAGFYCVPVMLRSDSVTLLAALSLAGCAGVLSGAYSPRLKRMAAAGLLMMFIIPLGSDNAIYNIGTITMWAAAPPAFRFIGRTCGKVVAAAVCLIITIGAVMNVMAGKALYFDDTPPARMTATSRAPEAYGLHTSPERAARLDSILDALAPHVRPGDTLMVFGSAPMLNHLTRTLPAAGCSWPELMSPAMLRRKLAEAAPPEHIAVMNFNTLGATWGDSSEDYARGLGEGVNRFHNKRKSDVIFGYIATHHYRKIAETADFTLYKKDTRNDERLE